MKKVQNKFKSTKKNATRVLAPVEPACFQNNAFKQCIQTIFSIFFQVLPFDRVFVSGGCLSRTYVDPDMHLNYQKSFGDIDFKLPNCTPNELKALFDCLNSGIYLRDSNDFPLVRAFNYLLSTGGTFKACYFKNHRVVINIHWNEILVDFVLFKESLEQHAEALDLSVTAGFYNPQFSAIFFPLDDRLEENEFGQLVPCDRSAIDFKNKQLNLVFPQRYQAIFDQDPMRILHIVKALTRSDFTLSQQLQNNLASYIQLKNGTIFVGQNPDRLYYNIKQLFFSGHAVKNLEQLIELNLLDQLFVNLSQLSTPLKDQIVYLIHCVAQKSDSCSTLSPSVLFYAVFWDRIKKMTYSDQIIFDCSNGKFKLPCDPTASNYNESLTQDIHNNNIDYLIECENLLDSNRSYFADTQENCDNLPGVDDTLNVCEPLVVENPKPTKKDTLSTNKNSANKKTNPKKQQPIQKTPEIIYAQYCENAMILLEEKQYKNAKKQFENAIQLNKTLPDAYRGLGLLFEKQANDLTPAVESACARMQSCNKETINKKLLIESKKNYDDSKHLQQEKLQKAKQYAQEALAIDSNDSQSVDLYNRIDQSIKIASTVLVEERSNAPIAPPKPKKDEIKHKTNNKIKKAKKDNLVSGNEQIQIPKLVHQLDEKLSELAKAKENEDLERYQQSIVHYNRLYVDHKSIESGHKCVELYETLERHNDAYRYITNLVELSEDDYNCWYQIQGDKLFNNYQYHHYFSLYQRGKIGLKLNKIRQSCLDFECIINFFCKGYKDLTQSLLIILVQTYIELGNYYELIVGLHSSSDENAEKCYLEALKLMDFMGDSYRYQLSEIYLKLGHIKRKTGHFYGDDSAKDYYEKALIILNQVIDSNFYSYDLIGQKLFQYAHNVGIDFINERITNLVSDTAFVLAEHDRYFLELQQNVCTRSILYTGSNFQKSHLFLIKIAMIFRRYDDAIFAIKRLMLGDLKKTSGCKRELYLLLGVCYEHQFFYNEAIPFYEKAQLYRYEDDNERRTQLIESATTACKRSHKKKKGALLFSTNDNSRSDITIEASLSALAKVVEDRPSKLFPHSTAKTCFFNKQEPEMLNTLGTTPPTEENPKNVSIFLKK